MRQHHALIIDDDARSIQVLVRLLAEADVASTSIPHPARLNDTLARLGTISLIFLDLEMPGENGFDLFVRLKALDQFDGVPIVAYSVHSSEIDRVRDAGFAGFLGKPLDADRFHEALASLLNGGQVWDVGDRGTLL